MRLPLLSLLALALIIPSGLALAPAPIVPTTPTGLVPDEVVLGFHDAIPADLEPWLAAHGARELMRDDVLGWVSVKLGDSAGADRLLVAAQLRGDVRYAERDAYVQALFTPNDPRYGEQWGFPAIFAPQAWDVTLGSHSARVAVLDTGVKGNHPDLAANICGSHASFVPGEVALQDGFGHGTHVAGTVAAVTNNGVGVAGTAQACVADVKVLSRYGGGQWTWVAGGIRFAADTGAHIISMSLGGGNPGAVMLDAVKYAYNTKNVLVIAAAGNSGCNNSPGNLNSDGSIIWPARYDEVMAVAALAPTEGISTAGFSSCGADMEISGPGQSVLSTLPPCPEAYLCSSSLYGSLSGTSMATPHVSGVAALVKGQDPAISAVALRCLLDLSSDDLLDADGIAPLPGRDPDTGWGRVSPVKALALDSALNAAGGMAAFEAACTAGAKPIMH